jgi:hypothetical protein
VAREKNVEENRVYRREEKRQETAFGEREW